MKSHTGTTVSFSAHYARPPAAIAVARNRMAGFVKEFGRTILLGAPMSLEAFAMSCYLQGCEDMAQVAIPEVYPGPLDFQI